MSESAFITATLNQRQWALLTEWVNRPTLGTKNGEEGGMQQRRRAWIPQMRPADRTIRLTCEASPDERRLDDVTWIAQQIANQRAGGYQMRIARIFTDTHPRLTGIAIKPRERR
jgi:hypothetical protein